MAPTPDSSPPAAADQPAPRFLRFVTALVLGTAVIAIPVALGGCDDGETPPPVDAAVDAISQIPDAIVVVDGPLPPPDLARLA